MLEDSLNKIYQNYLREFLISKDDIRLARAKLKRIYQSRETMIEHLKTQMPFVDPAKLKIDDITEELFQITKDRTFRELDKYEVRLNDESRN